MSVATIPAGLPFVDALAAGLLAEAGDDRLALADVLVLLPTRRACRSLGEAFLRRAAGRALLLPRIQPIGEIEADELLLDGTLELALPPAIGPLRRQLLLARLLAPLDWPLEHALRLAGELAALLDELQTERVPLDALDRLVPEALAEHWQKSQRVLAVLAEAWPSVLAAEGALDPAERRHRLLTSLADRWRRARPEGRIVAAGSTGSIPATRALLQVIARLPRATVVLPGLDTELDEASWQQLEASHPQYGLKQLLEALATDRAAVEVWPAPGVGGSDPARARFLSEVMRPSATVGAWQALAPPPAAAIRELVVEEHADLPAEALALALRMRGALEIPGRTAALVTPDRHLARRVAVELERWDIEVDDSAGTPLDQTPPGAFLLLSAQLIVGGVNPVTLLATLKHPLATAGLERSELRRLARELEQTCLRGPRLAGGFAGIQVELERARRRAGSDARRLQHLAGLAAFVRRIERAARPFAELAGPHPVELAALVRAHLGFVEALAEPAEGLWAREAGEAAASLFAELLEAAEGALPILPAAYPAALAQLMAARPVRPHAPKHPRLHIWGQLEARLQHADLLLLGGLNEGVWPRFVDPGPWLSGSMRQTLGLTPIERRIGLAAHDFAAAAAAGAVVLSRAEKDAEGSPTVPSRWLVRLKTLLAGSGGVELASAPMPVDEVPVPRPERRPAPKPPVHARPRELSVSDVALWMGDPYALYARRILKPQAARSARGRPRRARARHHHPPRARALREGLSGRPAGGRGASFARSRPDAVRGLQPPAAGPSALVAALRADRPLGDRTGAGTPQPGPRNRDRGRSSARARRLELSPQGPRRSPRTPAGRADHGDRLQDRGAAQACGAARRPRPAAAARGRHGRGRRVPGSRAHSSRRAPVLAAEGRRDRRRGAGGECDCARRTRSRGARGPAPPGCPLRSARDDLSRPAQAPGRLAGRLRSSGPARRMDQLSPAPASRPSPTPEQRRAADPSGSIWVTASAGTGKTRVLADRVMRLLLTGTDPRQILCLTFTKAAAAEMVKRVEADLSRFAVLPEAELAAELGQLAGRPSSAQERARARTLLALVLDLPAGLPIMTIHGFCQSLLKRFPLEAGVVPHFDVLDPRSAADLLREAQAEVLASRSAGIKAALDRLAVLLGEMSLAEGLAALREDRLRLGEVMTEQGVEPLIARLYDCLRLPPGADAGQIRRAACIDPEIDRPALLDAARRLAAGTDKDAARAPVIANWLTAETAERLRSWDDYATVFLTKGQKRRQAGSIISKACAAATPAAEAALLAEQARLSAWVERERSATVAERTAALLRVGAAVLNAYDRRKSELAALDFDDLIAASRRLLDQPGIASWVQYKLDQQIDHLLVDEGQDTSPEQWAIILALCADFFAGEGARALRRTLFVVGDEKQSIMSVQGADVATYRRFREVLEARARAGRQPWRQEPLGRSFRSARPILDLVDAVFSDPQARDGVVSGTDWPAHECFRTSAPGLVELWPLAEDEPPVKTDGWQLPDRLEASPRGETRVAKAIARRIFEWRLDAVPLASTGQPIRAGDVMVLLPRRGILQDLLIRELKNLQVPVAGADRLVLTDEIAVMDLMALGDALLLPEDDLTLAAVLRSPLFGLTEDELFELAYERGEATLFERLRAFRPMSARLGEAWERFSELLSQADFAPPFEFYARLLGAGGGRRRLLERLGPAAIEPVEAFLAQALAFEQGHPPSLQGFLQWLRADTTELIRDPDRPRDEVRVLTCHGAKGLEAPVVFIADAGFVPELKDRLLWLEAERLPLWRMGAKSRDLLSDAAHADARLRQLQEQRRLLYVALTRAREHLIVTGWQRRNQSEATWYDLVARGMARLGARAVPAGLAPEIAGDSLCHGSLPAQGAAQLRLALAAPAPVPPPPPWLRQPAPAEPLTAAPLSPSRAFADDAPAATSPLLGAAAGRFRRGRLIHRLLQSLPERPPAERAPALARYLAVPSLGLTEAARAEIAAEVLAVLALPELASLFGPEARAEVPLAGLVGGQAIFGQVDRLAVTEGAVLLLDYKTDRSPPATAADVPRAYLRQMAAYRALLEAIYPDRPVRCALLWTEGPSLMALDDAILARWRPGAGPA